MSQRRGCLRRKQVCAKRNGLASPDDRPGHRVAGNKHQGAGPGALASNDEVGQGPKARPGPGWPIGINRTGIPRQAALPRLPGPRLTRANAPAAGSHRGHLLPCLNAGASEEETCDCVDRPATQSAGHSPLSPGSDIRNGGVEYRCSTVQMEADAPVAPPAHLAKISAKAHHTRHS
jgi:hypothetical protein